MKGVILYKWRREHLAEVRACAERMGLGMDPVFEPSPLIHALYSANTLGFWNRLRPHQGP